jgi:hypothetical protein
LIRRGTDGGGQTPQGDDECKTRNHVGRHYAAQKPGPKAKQGAGRNGGVWTAAGSEAPRRCWKQGQAGKAVSSLRCATAVRIIGALARGRTIAAGGFRRACGWLGPGR